MWRWARHWVRQPLAKTSTHSAKVPRSLSIFSLTSETSFVLIMAHTATWTLVVGAIVPWFASWKFHRKWVRFAFATARDNLRRVTPVNLWIYWGVLLLSLTLHPFFGYKMMTGLRDLFFLFEAGREAILSSHIYPCTSILLRTSKHLEMSVWATQ